MLKAKIKRQGHKPEHTEGQELKDTSLKKKPEDGIWLTQDTGSYELFERLYKHRAGVVFGKIAAELGADEEIVFNDIAQPEDPPQSWAYMLAMEDAKLRRKENSVMRENRARMFDDIMMHLSLGSEQKVIQHENFANANVEKSAWELFNIIQDTHQAPQYVGRLGMIELRKELILMSIGRQSIANHARKFSQIYNRLIAMGDEEISPRASAEYFLTSLGPEMASELNRWGRDNDFPDNLPEAIRRATVFLESERNAAKMLEHNTGPKRAFPPRKGREGRKEGEVA